MGIGPMSNPQPGRPGSFWCDILLLATIPDIQRHWRPAFAIVTQLHCITRVIRSGAGEGAGSDVLLADTAFWNW